MFAVRSVGRSLGSNWVITWRLYDSCIHQVDINFSNHFEPSSNINRNTCGSTCVFDVSVPPKRNNWNRVNPTTVLRDSLAKWSKSELGLFFRSSAQYYAYFGHDHLIPIPMAFETGLVGLAWLDWRRPRFELLNDLVGMGLGLGHSMNGRLICEILPKVNSLRAIFKEINLEKNLNWRRLSDWIEQIRTQTYNTWA